MKKGKVVEKKHFQSYPPRQIQVVVSSQCADQCQLGVSVVGVVVAAVVKTFAELVAVHVSFVLFGRLAIAVATTLVVG